MDGILEKSTRLTAWIVEMGGGCTEPRVQCLSECVSFLLLRQSSLPTLKQMEEDVFAAYRDVI